MKFENMTVEQVHQRTASEEPSNEASRYTPTAPGHNCTTKWER